MAEQELKHDREAYMPLGEAATVLNVGPGRLSNIVYRGVPGVLEKARCPLVRGRRLIPRDALGALRAYLREVDAGR